MSDGKKRRKKRLKKSLSQSNSEPADNDSPGSISTANEPNVPDEIMHIKQEQMPITSQTDGQTTKSASQAAPMNLTNEHGKVKSEIDSLDYGTSESMEMHDYSNTVCKIGKCFMNLFLVFISLPNRMISSF